jgi:HEPN domain-containing protein
MAPSDEARQLLAAARKDGRALDGMIDIDVFADEVFGFHAQQAVEKALKAWAALLGIEFPRTHDLSLLLHVLEEHGQSVESLWDLLEFSPYAVQYRYEAFDEIGDPLDRKTVRERVGDLLRKVEALVEAAR